ncbi:MAG: FHA domain-containing protein [Prevotella sp.]|nr:FHA domain-containing protein [Prevotella sp.]MBQ6208988.1 FHA domain-containing protein [Prevotella sp.]
MNSAVRIKCPKCSATLEVRNAQGEGVKNIRCPKCGSTLQVRFGARKTEQQSIPLDVNDELGVETQFGGEVFTRAFLVCQGIRYELREGQNVVGRSSSKSVADIQLPTGDVYMSRSHANILVVKTGSGRLKCILSNGNNKNPIYINDVKLEQSDEVVLSEGDELKMGNTLVTFTNQE